MLTVTHGSTRRPSLSITFSITLSVAQVTLCCLPRPRSVRASPSGTVGRVRAPGRVTIGDVARHAGVSVATVSKVVNDRYGVSPATVARVQQVVAELGYESSLVARSLRGTPTRVIGILVAEFEPFSTEILKGASEAALGTGYELLAFSGALSRADSVGWE